MINSIFSYYGSFELENVFFCPYGLTKSIYKVIMDFHRIIWQKTSRASVKPKFLDHKTRKEKI